MAASRYQLLLNPSSSTTPTSSSFYRRRRKQPVNHPTSNPTTAVKTLRTRTRKATTPVTTIATQSRAPASSKDSRRVSTYPRRRKLAPTILVDNVTDCLAAVHRLSKCDRIAVDCEGVNLSRQGKLCLVQIASPDAVFFFDILGADSQGKSLGKNLFDNGGLRQLLENPTVWKVMHDCRHDSDALFHQFNVKLGPVIDTQVVFSVLRKARGMPVGLPVSMKTLLKKFANATEEELAMKDTVKDSMKGDGDFWLRRPLSEQALQYARLDVEHLLYVAELLAKYIRGADKNGWAKVLAGSRHYVTIFRDDEHGPRKAQQQYEQLARVARRQRVAFEKDKRVESHRQVDPLRKFTFDQVCVLHALAT